MPQQHHYLRPRSRALAALFVLSLLLCGGALGLDAAAQPAGQRAGQQQQQQQKKKLPAGARGFAHFANRDASDKLIVGGATRSVGAIASYQEGERLQQAGKLEEARKAFEGARDGFVQEARRRPDDSLVQYHLGVAYETLGQYAEATTAYEKALGLGMVPPESLFATYNLANSQAAAGNHVAAIATYEKLLQLQPELAMPYYNMGLSHAALKNYAAAVKDFAAAIRLQPEGTEGTNQQTLALAYYNLGATHGAAEQFDESAAAFRQAVRLDPANTDARYNLALAHLALGDRAAATTEINALRKSKPALADELSALMKK
ncbi:MAG: tetratricopeptide repeat protein [Pyrinomonadaceae bacterium]